VKDKKHTRPKAEIQSIQNKQVLNRGRAIVKVVNPFEIPFHFRDSANTVNDFLNPCTVTEIHKPPSKRSIAMYQTTTFSIRTSGVDEHVGGVAGDPRRALPDIVHGVSEVHHHTAWNLRALGISFSEP
jgi:hypothetical protein